MSRFEDRLLTYLIAEHGDALGEAPPLQLALPRGRLRVRPVLGAIALAVAAALAVLVIALSGGRGTPAYAVEVHSDGTVVLTLNDILGAPGANSTLEALGVRVRVIPVHEGCKAPAHVDIRADASGIVRLISNSGSKVSGGTVWTIRARLIPRGDVLGLTAQRGPHGSGVTGSTEALYRGAAPTCARPSTFHLRPGL
jgi:hypothetical protein